MRFLRYHNVVPSQSNLDEIDLNSYNVTFQGSSLGYQKEDTLSVDFAGIVKTIGVDQLAGTIAKGFLMGWDPSFTMTLLSTSMEFVSGVLYAGAAFNVRTGTTQDAFGVGTKKVNLELIAGELDIVPVANEPGVKTNSFRAWKAYSDPANGIKYIGSKNNFQELAVTFRCLADTDQDAGFEYCIFGNILADDTAPLSMMIVPNARWLYAGQVGLKAASIASGDQLQLDAVAFLGERSTTYTALVNDAGGTGTDTDIPYDGLAVAGSFAVGDILCLEGGTDEFVYVTAISATNITCIRGYNGSPISSHADDSTISLVTSGRRLRVTEQATWASSDATKATVGNTASAVNTANQKGRVAHVAAGSTNISATFNTVASYNLAITAS